MAWMWSSYEEFVNYVRPSNIQNAVFNLAKRRSRFVALQKIHRATDKLSIATNKLREMGFAEDPPARAVESLEVARNLTDDVTHWGEEILLYHKRLAHSRWAYDFLHEKDLDEHWDRYSATDRILRELGELVHAADALLDGFNQLLSEDEEFLTNGLELPDSLETEFVLARNLFSVGFEEVGVLIAGRGLEGVMRAFAERKGLKLSVQGKDKPASEADFHDLIECFYRARWRTDKSRLIDQDTRSLLQFLRTIRNSTAHPAARKQKQWRELAVIISSMANALWADAQKKRMALVNKTIMKDW